MRKFFICFAFFYLFSQGLFSQVYISETSNDIFVGPQNVFTLNEQIKEIYIADLENEIEKIKLDSNSENQTSFNEDIQFLENLLVEWKEVEPMKIEEDQEYCYFSEASQEFKSIEYNSFLTHTHTVSEFIHYQKLDGDKEWVKRAAKNCDSPNPEDCMVWCLEIIPEYLIEDFVGTEVVYTVEDDVFDFQLSEQGNYLERFVQLEFEQEVEIDIFLDAESEKQIPAALIELCSQ